jgi:hypothetical protein
MVTPAEAEYRQVKMPLSRDGSNARHGFATHQYDRP